MIVTKKEHEWGPWDHMFDEWGTHNWFWIRKCIHCGAGETADSRTICELRGEVAK